MFISPEKIKIILIVFLLGIALFILGGVYFLKNEFEKQALQNQLENLKYQVEDKLTNNNSDKNSLAGSIPPSKTNNGNQPAEIPLNPGSSASSLQGLGGSAMPNGAPSAGQDGATSQSGQPSNQSQSQPQPEATPPTEPVSFDMDVKKWKTYNNKKYGYSFKYPSEFDSRECTNEDPCLKGQAFEKEDGNIGFLAAGKNNQQGWPVINVTCQDNESYKLPKDQKLATWVKTKFPNTTVPKNYNYQVSSSNGNPKKALKFLDSAGNKDEVYFILKDDKVMEIQLMGIDKEGAKNFYDVWLKTFNLK